MPQCNCDIKTVMVDLLSGRTHPDPCEAGSLAATVDLPVEPLGLNSDALLDTVRAALGTTERI